MSDLIAVVHVKDEDGNTQIFSPGDTVPAWAAKQITNPKAWSGEPPITGTANAGETVIAAPEVKAKRGPGRPPKATTEPSGE